MGDLRTTAEGRARLRFRAEHDDDPVMWREHPEIRCDAPDCAAKILVGANSRPPPSWFLNGRAAPRWSLKRLPEGRVDLCPAHRPRGEP